MVNEEVVRRELGRRIVAVRESKGMSQKELAGRLGVYAGSLGHWERGNRLPSLMQLLHVAAALEVGLDELVLGGSLSLPGVSPVPAEQYRRLSRHLETALRILKAPRSKTNRNPLAKSGAGSHKEVV